MEKTCIKCGMVLVVEDNWLESQQKINVYICRHCHVVEAKKYYERNMANGMCSHHKDRPRVEGHKRCQQCLDKVKARHLISSSIPGICPDLGCNRPQLKEVLRCQEHNDRDKKNSSKSDAIRLGMKFHPEVAAHICLDFQKGKCAICGIKPNSHALHRDHNHQTGWFRGYLCGPCNMKLVSAGVDKSVEAAIKPFVKYALDQSFLLKIIDYLDNPPYFRLLDLMYFDRPTGTWKQYMKHYNLHFDLEQEVGTR